ncbi:MAG: hypothetical protein KKE50_00055 [Nanoarchaeota archaeon]|nr:hypothetical protein [Nanoarchaeota archaeon]
MTDEISPLKKLKARASAIQRANKEINALEKRVNRREKRVQSKFKEWENLLHESQARVKSGQLSIGDNFENYVFANYRFFQASDFPAKFKEYVENLRGLMDKLSDKRCFWYHRNEPKFWAKSADVYKVLFLRENAHDINPAEIKLQSKSSLVVSLETVFLDNEVRWPFTQKISQAGELVVAPRGANHDYPTPEISPDSCGTEKLEEILSTSPLALIVFRRAISLHVNPDMQERANQYVHEVALKAFRAIKEGFESVKENDRQIMEIEARYNSPQRETGMFATRPVIIDPEPDPFLAALMSSDARTNRDIGLKRLAICMNDLDKTGLARYDIPLEENIGVGQKAVSNLAEFSNYVRNILELGYKPQETAQTRS